MYRSDVVKICVTDIVGAFAISVSYTHLDVYKRQVYNHSNYPHHSYVHTTMQLVCKDSVVCMHRNLSY